MLITQTLYVTDRKQWRAWLKANHRKAKEIWLIYYKKHSKKPRIPYDDAVEEALCFGWIDSTAKTIDHDSYAQRFSPRRKGSFFSELNKARAEKMIRQRKMTRFGLEALAHTKSTIPEAEQNVLAALRRNTLAWRNFTKFPASYQRIRISWVAATKRPETYRQRLNYLIKMSEKNKRFGTKV